MSKEGLIGIGWQNKIANVKREGQKYNARPSMSLRFKIIFTVLYAACFLNFLAFGVRPTNMNGLLGLPFGLLFLVISIWSLVVVFKKWKTSRFWAATSLIACLLMLPVERQIGRFIREELFDLRFPKYEALVQKIESGKIPISTEGRIIPATNYDSSLAFIIFASRDTNGVLIVDFGYGEAGPPPYHEDYIYISSGTIESNSYLDNRWPSKAKIRDKWFEVAN